MITQREIADFIYEEEQRTQDSDIYNVQIVVIHVSELNIIEVIRAGFEETWEYQMWIDDRLKKLRENKVTKYYVIRNGHRDITSDEFFDWYKKLPEE